MLRLQEVGTPKMSQDDNQGTSKPQQLQLALRLRTGDRERTTQETATTSAGEEEEEEAEYPADQHRRVERKGNYPQKCTRRC